MRNNVVIDWDSFKEWQNNNIGNEKYSKLLEGFEGWEDDDYITWETALEEINAGTIPHGGEAQWLIDNIDNLELTEFLDWAYEEENNP